MRRLLILEDNLDFVGSLRRSLSSEFEIVHASSVAQAESLVDDTVTAALVDLFLDSQGEGNPDGLDLVKWLARTWQGTPSIVVTGYDRPGLERLAMRAGASDFIVKSASFNSGELMARIDAAVERKLIERARDIASPEPPVMEGQSRAVQELRRVLQIAAGDPSARILLRGEPGTRKNLVARAFAMIGANRDGPYIAIECSGLDVSGLRSAIGNSSGGVLFLSEVGHLPKDAQADLVTYLDSSQVSAGSPPMQIVSSTSANLDQAVDQGEFLTDLHSLLGVLAVRIPSLRERKADIRVLAEAYLAAHTTRKGFQRLCFSDEALTELEHYSWPGNIRELWGVLDVAGSRAYASRSRTVTPEHLSGLIRRQDESGDDALHNRTIFERIARFELSEVVSALRKTGGKKEQARDILQYPSRHTMRRRLDVIRQKHPEIWADFPELDAYYGERDDD